MQHRRLISHAMVIAQDGEPDAWGKVLYRIDGLGPGMPPNSSGLTWAQACEYKDRIVRQARRYLVIGSLVVPAVRVEPEKEEARSA